MLTTLLATTFLLLAPTYTLTAAYAVHTLHGFRVRVSPDAAHHPAEFDAALKLLGEKLGEVYRLVPAPQLAKLRQVTFWVEWEARPNGASEYHVSVDWLRAHGYNPEKVGGVEISNVRNFVAWCRGNQPMMVLHELAHAYHHRVLGRNDPRVLAAYKAAVASGRYDSVPYNMGGRRRAYALNDDAEYFAELSEAWFGRNDFYPFTRDELRTFDPAGYALMRDVWSGAASQPGRAGLPRRSPESVRGCNGKAYRSVRPHQRPCFAQPRHKCRGCAKQQLTASGGLPCIEPYPAFS